MAHEEQDEATSLSHLTHLPDLQQDHSCVEHLGVKKTGCIILYLDYVLVFTPFALSIVYIIGS